MNLSGAKKLSLGVNTLLLSFVLGMLVFFRLYDVSFMVYFSIPTICVYLINYFLIYKERLSFFVWLVYFWIVLYMTVATVCLGYNFGFHLYSMSLIPIIFCTDYMAYKLNTKRSRALVVSLLIAVTYLISTGYSIRRGPVYSVDGSAATIFLVFNALAVFSFLIFYTRLLLNMVIDSEEKLMKMAHRDRLTGLYNRHYMIEHLTTLKQEADGNAWVAMVDIDNFKNINDTYGHNCGDYVLIHLSEIMQEKCEGCSISRWGGEEFLIMADGNGKTAEIPEQFRKEVEAHPFVYENTEIKVTVTIGVAKYRADQSIDEWIRVADERLYYGKNNGKNRVVQE